MWNITFGKDKIIKEVYRIQSSNYWIVKEDNKYNFYYRNKLGKNIFLKGDLKYPMIPKMNPYDLSERKNNIVIREGVKLNGLNPGKGNYHFFVVDIYLNEAYPVLKGKSITAWSDNSPYKTINVIFSDRSFQNKVSLPDMPSKGKYTVNGISKNMN